jgi:hypothetical protein
MAADLLNTWTKKADFEDEKGVAEIWTDENYDDLGLVQGLNELSLKYVPPAPGRKEQWVAVMRPKGSTQGTALAVVRFEGEPCCTSATAYPGVARWDYDEKDHHQLIGIKCGDGWCAIGRQPKYQNSYVGGKKRRVKGWLDEQRLAVRDKSGEPLKPSKHGVSTIFAVDNLESYTKPEDFEKPDWIHVATISSPQEYPKLGLIGSPGIQAEMYLHHVASPAAWSARIISIDKKGKATTSEFKVDMVGHDGEDIPGVARWGWDDNDETIWVRCANGCCQVVPPKEEISQSDSTKVVPRKCPDGKQCGDTTRPKPKADTARPKPKSAAN